MKFEKLQHLTLPKIGFGTWNIGGGSTARPALDGKSAAALRCALQLGYVHFDTAEMYANGHAEELLGQAVRETGTKRETLFITSKVKPEHLGYEQILQACDASLKRLGLGYIDLYLIHWPSPGMKLEQAFRALNKLVQDGQVRHLGVSNFDLKLLKRSQALCATPILTDQVPYSLSERSYVRKGVLAYCQQNDILLTAYEPVDKGRLHVQDALRSVAAVHQATAYQIALAWLTAQPRVIAIPMSFDPRHIQENLLAADIVLTPAEMQQLA